MNRRIHGLSTILAAAALVLAAASSPASAQSEKRGDSFDLFGAYIRAIDPDIHGHTESYGLRGGFRFNNVWALEGSASRLNQDFDTWFGDLSAKAYFVHSDRFEIYGLTGPGVYKFSDVERMTVHLGLGAEIRLGEHAYLRPEVRGRWLARDPTLQHGLAEFSLGIGWRF